MNKRFHCPSCNKKEFTRYINIDTNEHIHPDVGLCNRLANCGYHLSPKQYFQDNNIKLPKSIRQFVPQPKKSGSFIDNDVFLKSLKGYEANNFVTFLRYQFGESISNLLIERYNIGTSKNWNGATIFWQVDVHGRVRTGKIMQYNPITGRRVKECINWVHSVLKMPDFTLKQCFFGEHLLTDKAKPIGIVESEKTAIIASWILPDLIWIACGSLNNLNDERCKSLKGRKVILFPDNNGFDKWKLKADEFGFETSSYIKKISTIEEAKLDIADYLLREWTPVRT